MDVERVALGAARLLRARRAGAARSVLVVGFNGCGNVGADLRTAALLRRLRSAPDGGPTVTLAKLGGAPTDVPGVTREVSLPARYVPSLLSLVSRHDAVLIAEGCAFSDAGADLYALALALALRQGKAAVAPGVGVSTLSPERADRVARRCRGATLTARDEASRQRLASLGLHASPGADLAWDVGAPRWTLDDEAASVADVLSRAGLTTPVPLVALAPGPLRADGRAGDRDVEEYLDGIARAVRAVRARRPCFAVVVAMDPRDRGPAEGLGWRLGAPTFARDGRGPLWLAALLQRSDVVVSGRYHAALLGAARGAAPIALAPDERLVGLLDALGEEALRVPCEHPILLRDPLERALDAALTGSGDARARRLRAVDAQRQHLDATYALLWEALGRTRASSP